MQLEPIVARRPQSASVTGRLTLPDGRPVANATVRASSAGEGFRSFGEAVEATTDHDGRFAFALGGQQAYRIASRMELGSVEVDTVATADLDLPLVLRR